MAGGSHTARGCASSRAPPTAPSGARGACSRAGTLDATSRSPPTSRAARPWRGPTSASFPGAPGRAVCSPPPGGSAAGSSARARSPLATIRQIACRSPPATVTWRSRGSRRRASGPRACSRRRPFGTSRSLPSASRPPRRSARPPWRSPPTGTPPCSGAPARSGPATAPDPPARTGWVSCPAMSRPKIVVTRRIPEPAVELLREAGDVWVSPDDRPLERQELHDAVTGADIAVTLLHDKVDDAFLDAAGDQLRAVCNVAVGFDNIDVPAATKRGVLITNTPGVLTEATADLAMTLILAATRRIGEGERLIRKREPWSWHMFMLLGMGLQDKTLGVVGMGQIGVALARRARAFGMQIVYSDARPASEEVERELGARRVELDELLSTADVVSIHAPLMDSTRHLINAETLGLMKETAYLVNSARGPIVDEAALVDALKAGQIAGAGLDVFENEPETHPGLLELDNVVLLPHLGSATIETRTAMGVLAAKNAVALLNGEQPPTPVNPEVLEGSSRT